MTGDWLGLFEMEFRKYYQYEWIKTMCWRMKVVQQGRMKIVIF